MRKKKGKEGRKEKEKREGGKKGERKKEEGRRKRKGRWEGGKKGKGEKGRREEGGVYRYVQCKSEPDEKGHKGTVCVKRLSHLPLP